jgi:two-component system, response regulator
MHEHSLPELVLIEDTIDDELKSLEGIQRSGIHCSITVKRDGAEALNALVEQEYPTPALVLLDYELPGKNGLDILRVIRANERIKLAPVVIFSEDHSHEAVIDCYRHGANSWIKKPNDPDDYIENIARLVRYWLSLNEQSDRPFI